MTVVKTQYLSYNEARNQYYSPDTTFMVVLEKDAAVLLYNAGIVSDEITLTPDLLFKLGRDFVSIAKSLMKHNADEDFERFWKLYPNKRGGKKQTRELWDKINDFLTYEDIIQNVQDRLKLTEWGEYSGTQNEKFIVHSTRYLRQKMWLEEIKPLKTARNSQIMEQEFDNTDTQDLIEKPLEYDL